MLFQNSPFDHKINRMQPTNMFPKTHVYQWGVAPPTPGTTHGQPSTEGEHTNLTHIILKWLDMVTGLFCMVAKI